MVSNPIDPFRMFNDLRGKLTVIAGRPCVGISFFMQDIINKCKGRKLYFNLCSKRESIEDHIKVNDVEVITIPITIEDIRTTCEAMVNYGLRIVLIDYLQLVKTREKFDSFAEEQSFILKELKKLAVDFNVSVIVLSTLPKRVDHRVDKKPNLLDVKSNMKRNADVIMFLFLHFFHELIIVQNFNRRLGSMRLTYDDQSASFKFVGTDEEKFEFMNIFNDDKYY